MPTPYGNLDTYLRPGHPKERADEASIGNLYMYRSTTTIVTANKPAIGDTWADGRPVTVAEVFEISGASLISDLMVMTRVDLSSAVTVASSLEQTEYELDWRPVIKPLEVHPKFQTGGSWAIDQTGRKYLLGWKAEMDPDLKSQRKYKALDSNGEPSGTTTTISGNALELIKQWEAGVEEFVDYMPVWRKRSIYKGSAAPSTSSIGLKTTTPSGSGYPSGYEWVKSKDGARRVGRAARWQRDEEWEGAIKVYADKADVFTP